MNDPYHYAKDRSRMHYLRWEKLPRWRWRARRRALKAAEQWGRISILAKMQEQNANSRTGKPDHQK